ncbi:MAG: 6-phosphofructokinase [Bacillota bacterium]|nr:6-phosphofructokinase [Bacillota bacterium]
MRRLGVLTSGGDAPGMNAAIRAVVRTALHYELEVYGIRHGFHGLMHDDMVQMSSRSVGDIIHRGGTILRTARAEEFRTEEGKKRALAVLESRGLEGLVVIGGDGSFRGAAELAASGKVKVVGIPGTIDNDIPGTDFTVGFDTAVNNVVDAINKIRDTATSHERVYVVEVMGRHTGFIALSAGLAGGAESILIPEEPYDLEELCARVLSGYRRGKSHSIIVVAEGIEGGPVPPGRGCELESPGFKVGRYVQQRTGLETRVIILGHIQRGGTPTVLDRTLATLFGARAVEVLRAGRSGVMVGVQGQQVVEVPFEEVFARKKAIPHEVWQLANVLSLT